MKGSCNQDELSEPFLQQWNNEAKSSAALSGAWQSRSRSSTTCLVADHAHQSMGALPRAWRPLN